MVLVSLLPLDARVGKSETAIAPGRNLTSKNLFLAAFRAPVHTIDIVQGFRGFRWRDLARPVQHDSRTSNPRAKILWRWQRAHQRDSHLIRKPGPAAFGVEHLDGIRDRCGGIIARNLTRERVGVRRFGFWSRRLRRRRIAPWWSWRGHVGRRWNRRRSSLAHGRAALRQRSREISANPGWSQIANHL